MTKTPKTYADLNEAELRSIRRLSMKKGRSTWTEEEIALRIGTTVEVIRQVVGTGAPR